MRCLDPGIAASANTNPAGQESSEFSESEKAPGCMRRENLYSCCWKQISLGRRRSTVDFPKRCDTACAGEYGIEARQKASIHPDMETGRLLCYHSFVFTKILSHRIAVVFSGIDHFPRLSICEFLAHKSYLLVNRPNSSPR